VEIGSHSMEQIKQQSGVQRLAEQGDLLELAFDAIFVRTFSDRRITYWNRGATELYGWSREEAIGQVPSELLHSEYPVPLEEIEQQLLLNGRWKGDLSQRRRDGGLLVVAGRWALQRDEDGRPDSILEINTDVTAAKAALQQLRTSEELFRLLVSGTLDYAIFMLDPDGRVASWNEGAQRIKGYRESEIVGRHFSVFYPPEDVRSGKPSWELLIAEREGRFEDEGWRLRKDGSRFWANVVITALRDQGGNLRGFGKVTRDVTDRKRAEEQRAAAQAQEADRLRAYGQRMAELEQVKTEFLNLASHELRSPLTVVRGYLSMLEDGTLDLEQMSAVTPVVSAKLAQMDLLIKQLLETSRLEHDEVGLKLETVDLNQVAAEQVAMFRPLALARQLQFEPDPEPALVVGDSMRLGTIVANLLDNAIKYSLDGGVIECSVASAGGHVFLSIRDHGIGIAPDQLSQLFKRFGRLETEANVTIGGTGLGLYLSREIAQRHGGDVLVESWPGKGSRFTLSLPAGEVREPRRHRH